jgi:hypothetical protein
MEELIQQIIDGKLGLISMVAKYGQDNNDLEGVIDALGQQAVKDAPDATRKHLGNKLYNDLVKQYNALPENKKTYTTGK